MKFTVDLKAFRAQLAIVGKMVPAKTFIPVLSCVKIVTNDDRIMVGASNMDMSAEVQLAADVMTEGAACVNFASLAAFCAVAKGTLLEIDATPQVASVRCGKATLALSPLPAEDFPVIAPAAEDLVTVDAPTFLRALKFAVAAAAEDDPARTYLQGAALIEGDDCVTVWGTDGTMLHRGVLHGLPRVGGGGILPTAAVTFMLAAADKSDTLRVSVNERGWHMVTGDLRAWGKMVDGVYPSAQRVVDSLGAPKQVIVAPRDEITGAMNVAGVGADDDKKLSRPFIMRAAAGEPVVIRGTRAAAGVVRAGRAETDTRAVADAVMKISAGKVGDTLSCMPNGEVVVSAHGDFNGIGAMRIEPAQQDAALSMLAVIVAIRATEAELADVG